jgi:hypothetical protein
MFSQRLRRPQHAGLWDHEAPVTPHATHFSFPLFVIQCDDTGQASETAGIIDGQREEYRRVTHCGDRLARKVVRPGLGDGLALRPEEREHYSTQYNRRDGWFRAVIGTGLVLAAGTLFRLKSVGHVL